jgi:hypothetical protein
MSQPPQTVEGTLRFVRTVHGVLLFAMFMQVLAVEKFLPHQLRKLDSTFVTAILVLSIAIAGATVFIRLKMVVTALDTLRSMPDDPNSLAKWRKDAVLSDVLLDTVVLYGFVLRFQGGTPQQCLPFYAAGIGLMILWWPKRP